MFTGPEYRIYFLSGSVVLSRDVQCVDDEAAIEQAGRLYPVGIIEVWQGHRLVSRIENLPAIVHSLTDENVTAA